MNLLKLCLGVKQSEPLARPHTSRTLCGTVESLFSEKRLRAEKCGTTFRAFPVIFADCAEHFQFNAEHFQNRSASKLPETCFSRVLVDFHRLRGTVIFMRNTRNVFLTLIRVKRLVPHSRAFLQVARNNRRCKTCGTAGGNGAEGERSTRETDVDDAQLTHVSSFGSLERANKYGRGRRRARRHTYIMYGALIYSN